MPKHDVPGLDLGFLDELGLPDEVKERLTALTVGRVKEFQRGMTLAQEEAAKSREKAQKADQWDKWARDNRLEPILSDWGKIQPHISRFGSAEEVARALSGQTKGDTKQATTDVQEVLEEVVSGDLSWEDGQKKIGVIDHNLRALSGDVRAVKDWREKELPDLVSRFEMAIGAVQRTQTEQLAGLLPVLVDAMKFTRDYPKRDPYEVIKTMGEKGHKTFGDAAHALFGEEDLESRINGEVEKRLQVKEEGLRREREKQNGGEPAAVAVPVSTFHVRGETDRKVATNPNQWRESVLKEIVKIGGI